MIVCTCTKCRRRRVPFVRPCCTRCKEPRGAHRAGDLACPLPSKRKTHRNFYKDQFYTPPAGATP